MIVCEVRKEGRKEKAREGGRCAKGAVAKKKLRDGGDKRRKEGEKKELGEMEGGREGVEEGGRITPQRTDDQDRNIDSSWERAFCKCFSMQHRAVNRIAESTTSDLFLNAACMHVLTFVRPRVPPLLHSVRRSVPSQRRLLTEVIWIYDPPECSYYSHVPPPARLVKLPGERGRGNFVSLV